MKPTHLVFALVGLLMTVSALVERKASPQKTEPLATNEVPTQFADLNRFPPSLIVDLPPLMPPPRPRTVAALREPWQTNALNQAIHWLLTEGFKHYTTAPLTSAAGYHLHELPQGFVPSIPEFHFRQLPWPETNWVGYQNDVNVRIVSDGGWVETKKQAHPWARGMPGELVATFHATLIGRAGMAIVDMNGTFGVFKTTNGLVTKNLGWFDP